MMTLLHYLSKNFFTEMQLLEVDKVSAHQLDHYQRNKMMPKASYVVKANLICDSFFGEYQEATETEYYAKGYAAWLGMLQVLPDPPSAYTHFRARYKTEIDRLMAAGFTSEHEKLHQSIESHIRDEWGHFLDGTYGLCTKSGLPEDIAAKELATLIINEITQATQGTQGDMPDPTALQRLTDAVSLLDAASSQFAPHEFERSSRKRLIDQVRQHYRLPHSIEGKFTALMEA